MAPNPASAPVQRLTNPTFELQSLALQAEERAPVDAVRYPRARPLAPGTTRPRDGDRDPQVIWNGVRVKLTEGQRRQLQETARSRSATRN